MKPIELTEKCLNKMMLDYEHEVLRPDIGALPADTPIYSHDDKITTIKKRNTMTESIIKPDHRHAPRRWPVITERWEGIIDLDNGTCLKATADLPYNDVFSLILWGKDDIDDITHLFDIARYVTCVDICNIYKLAWDDAKCLTDFINRQMILYREIGEYIEYD